jgi:hypothetical protein
MPLLWNDLEEFIQPKVEGLSADMITVELSTILKPQKETKGSAFRAYSQA